MVDQDLSRDTPGEAAVMRRRRLLLAAGAALLVPAARADESALQRIRARGRLTVAVYQDMPPFHVDGRGIDVEIAQALAHAVGVPLALLPFQADENMGDDLRNMVWR